MAKLQHYIPFSRKQHSLTILRPAESTKKSFCKAEAQSVGLPGLEPGKAGPESAVLPLHHSPIPKCDAKVQLFFIKQKFSEFFYLKNQKKTSFIPQSIQKAPVFVLFSRNKEVYSQLKRDTDNLADNASMAIWHAFCGTACINSKDIIYICKKEQLLQTR